MHRDSLGHLCSSHCGSRSGHACSHHAIKTNPTDPINLVILAGIAVGGLALYQYGKPRGWWGSGHPSAPNSGSGSSYVPYTASDPNLPGNYVSGEPTNFYNPTGGAAYVVPGGAIPASAY